MKFEWSPPPPSGSLETHRRRTVVASVLHIPSGLLHGGLSEGADAYPCHVSLCLLRHVAYGVSPSLQLLLSTCCRITDLQIRSVCASICS
jgi:hypothetical protein